MKRLIIITTIALVIISCKQKQENNFQAKNEPKSLNIINLKDKIIGVWTPNEKNSTIHNIIDINFKKDLTANIQVLDSIGKRTIVGTWDTEKTENYKKLLTNLGISDSESNPAVILEYLRNGKGMNIISFSKKDNSNEFYLKAGEATFKKNK